MKTKLLIEQHFHGCFGIDFNTASVDDVLYLSKEILKYGIGGIFPTLVTDTPENYKLIEDDFIKIITLAPELDEGLLDYLSGKNIKIQAGHCKGGDLTKCTGCTHLFNAMSGVTHRESSTALSALINDNIYTEIIADGIHVSNDALNLVFKTKPLDKIILISDSLPITKSNLKEMTFADEKIFYDGIKATSKEGTIAGSTALLPDIIKRLAAIGLFNPEYINNPYNYHNIELDGYIEWDEDWNII